MFKDYSVVSLAFMQLRREGSLDAALFKPYRSVCQDNRRAQELHEHDHVFTNTILPPDARNVSLVVLYTDLTHASVHEVLKMLLVFAKKEPLVVALRYKRPERFVSQQSALANDHVAGFQVDLRLKST